MHRRWGEKVRARRQGIYTQEALADLIGVDQSTISRIERGQFPLSDTMKFKIAGALGVTLDELFPYPAVVPPFPQQVA